ncbi:MAG TPA: PH domain-containing protein [Opitutus sp.]|nr:PH domain-containing protein [Opitutus sp.]
MYEPLRRRVLALLKVPPEPHPPVGDPASLRVFRAGRNYYRLRVAAWGITQVLALAGIVFWTVTLIGVENAMRAEPPDDATPPANAAAVSAQPARAAPTASAQPNLDQRIQKWKDRFAQHVKAAATHGRSAGDRSVKREVVDGWAGFKQVLVEIGRLLPPWAFLLIWALKIAGFVLYLVQIPFTYAIRRLDYEMHWYLVTDRSLRLRRGVWRVRESTMSFANLQQVVVTRGPVQGLLGLADVKVTSAGGGKSPHGKPDEDMHTGHFHAVEHAEEIRDLILKRLEQFRATGLGDPDDHPEHAAVVPARPAPVAVNDPTNAIAAAKELLAEARLLRSAITR